MKATGKYTRRRQRKRNDAKRPLLRLSHSTNIPHEISYAETLHTHIGRAQRRKSTQEWACLLACLCSGLSVMQWEKVKPQRKLSLWRGNDMFSL